MTDDTPERWLPIPGYEGFYEVSDLGRVRGVDRWVDSRWDGQYLWRGKMLKVAPNRGGYLRVSLCMDGKVRVRQVHNLVLEAFTGPRPGSSTGPDRIEGRHLDGNPSNNAADNLAWGTRQENWEDRRRHGRDYNSAKTHCKHGHPFDEANTKVMIVNGAKTRRCRTCMRLLDLKRSQTA